MFLLATCGWALAAPLRPPSFEPWRSLAPLVTAVEPALVTLEVGNQVPSGEGIPTELLEILGPSELGQGTGFLFDPSGLVLTNVHVVEAGSTLIAQFRNGEAHVATLVGSDRDLDIAVLQLPKDRSWPYVELGDSSQVRVGDWVLALGNTLGLGLTASVGVVSAKSLVLGEDRFREEDFIQTDAAINFGNSGGPLFDLRGRVVGMNSILLVGANNVGFALSSNAIQSVLDDLTTQGRVTRGYVGVGVQTLSRALRRELGLSTRSGALVTQVFADSPAEKAGLRVGDVVVSMNDESIQDRRDLLSIIGRTPPGQAVQLGVERRGKALAVEVMVEILPEE